MASNYTKEIEQMYKNIGAKMWTRSYGNIEETKEQLIKEFFRDKNITDAKLQEDIRKEFEAYTQRMISMNAEGREAGAAESPIAAFFDRAEEEQREYAEGAAVGAFFNRAEEEQREYAEGAAVGAFFDRVEDERLAALAEEIKVADAEVLKIADNLRNTKAFKESEIMDVAAYLYAVDHVKGFGEMYEEQQQDIKDAIVTRISKAQGKPVTRFMKIGALVNNANNYFQNRVAKAVQASVNNVANGRKVLQNGVATKWFERNKGNLAAIASLGLGAAWTASAASSAAGMGGLGLLPTFYVAGICSTAFPPILGATAILAGTLYLANKYVKARRARNAQNQQGQGSSALSKAQREEVAIANNQKSGRKLLQNGVLPKWLDSNKNKLIAMTGLGLGALWTASAAKWGAGMGGLGLVPDFTVLGVASSAFPPILGAVAVGVGAIYLIKSKYDQKKANNTNANVNANAKVNLQSIRNTLNKTVANAKAKAQSTKNTANKAVLNALKRDVRS